MCCRVDAPCGGPRPGERADCSPATRSRRTLYPLCDLSGLTAGGYGSSEQSQRAELARRLAHGVSPARSRCCGVWTLECQWRVDGVLYALRAQCTLVQAQVREHLRRRYDLVTTTYEK
jgi:hypothetical protein